MCVVIDGYKMFRVYDKLGIGVPVAAYCEIDAFERAVLRGIKDPQYAQWHECYGEYVQEVGDIERAILRLDIKKLIFADIGEYP